MCRKNHSAASRCSRRHCIINTRGHRPSKSSQQTQAAAWSHVTQCYQYTSNMIWKRGHHQEAEEKEIQSVKVLALLLGPSSSTWGKTTLDGWAAGSK